MLYVAISSLKGETSMKWIWTRIKIGVVPLVILAIPFVGASYIWGVFVNMGLHLFKRQWIDVPVSIVLVLALCLLSGILLLRPKFQDFFKEVLPAIPIVGPILLRILVPKDDLRLIEVQTYDGNWEYAISMHAWTEDGITWYRVHTLGFGSGKLFSRVAEKNILIIPDNKQHDAWVVVLSIGLLSGEHHKDSK